MRYLYKQTGLQEIPDKISLIYGITGCHFNCKGCHSPGLHNAENGVLFTLKQYKTDLMNNLNAIDVVVFMIGTMTDEIIDMIYKITIINRNYNIGTGIYTYYELDDIPDLLEKNLDYIKTGAYIESLGGLDSSSTNQTLWKRNYTKWQWISVLGKQ